MILSERVRCLFLFISTPPEGSFSHFREIAVCCYEILLSPGVDLEPLPPCFQASAASSVPAGWLAPAREPGTATPQGKPRSDKTISFPFEVFTASGKNLKEALPQTSYLFERLISSIEFEKLISVSGLTGVEFTFSIKDWRTYYANKHFFVDRIYILNYTVTVRKVLYCMNFFPDLKGDVFNDCYKNGDCRLKLNNGQS